MEGEAAAAAASSIGECERDSVEEDAAEAAGSCSDACGDSPRSSHGAPSPSRALRPPPSRKAERRVDGEDGERGVGT